MSEKSYWIVLIIGLSIFIAVDFIWIMPIAWDIGVNLFTDAIFMILTIVFLTLAFNYREKVRKKSLNEKVEERLGRQLYSVFNIIRKFVVTKRRSVRLTKQEFLDELKEQSNKEKLILDDYAENYFPKPADRLYGLELENLFRSRNLLSVLEVKHLEFLEPELRLSLMEIQRSLDALSSTVHFMKEMEIDLEAFSKYIAKDIHCIMKEIYKIHKMGIEIYRKQT